MFKWYGILGAILILLVEINFFLQIEPFASKYFIIVWIGYILLIDAVVYKLRNHSLLMNKRFKFLGLFLASIIFWWVFEFMNLKVGNWNYNGSTVLNNVIWKTLYFSTVLPALFETYELVRSFHWFDKLKLHKKHNISKNFIFIMITIGVVSFILPLISPANFFPLIWLTFFFILDPINYLHKQPSIIKHLKDRKLVVPLSILAAGIIMGFLWEFWNFFAVTKWYYDIPFIGFFKIFEMPILGYLGYFPFALELYAMYYFVQSLFVQKEPLLRT